MAGSERRKRQRVAHLRCNDPEWSALADRAENAGVRVGAYIRMVVFQTKPLRSARRPVKDGKLLALVLAGLGKLGSNVNQMAHSTHLGDPPALERLNAIAQDIRAMRALLMQALGVRRGGHDDQAG